MRHYKLLVYAIALAGFTWFGYTLGSWKVADPVAVTIQVDSGLERDASAYVTKSLDIVVVIRKNVYMLTPAGKLYMVDAQGVTGNSIGLFSSGRLGLLRPAVEPLGDWLPELQRSSLYQFRFKGLDGRKVDVHVLQNLDG